MKVELLFITPNAEKLIESAGRTCYLSFGKQGEGTEKAFVKMLIKMGHLSVLEHAYATFRISGVSRAFTHQLVRHRLCSYSQQSQRYVDESNFSYVEPDSIKNNPEAHSLFEDFMDKARKTYSELQKLGIKNEDARFVLPNAVETQIVVTANLREWRHIIELRGEPGAQWEIRRAAVEILKILKKHAPTVFADFEIDEKNTVVRKVKL
jgi:thymidylate synthase (FAD)